ncbi:MAG: LysR family transcriptional regulator [Verrucomicrobiales bacterium]|nr:LysR family transcriptional regulator [Verrucomicrobiales bacterium]
MLPDIEFHHLRAFLVVARLGNFTRAAGELGLSQSALSRTIQKLELQIGQPVFDRKPREVILTDVGKLLLERAKSILALVEDTFAEITESDTFGKIRIGAIPTIAPYFLPGILQSYAKKYANVTVSVQEDTSANLLRKCNHGDIDVAILALPFEVQYLKAEPLFEEELLLLLPKGHPLEKQKEIHIAEVKSTPMVMLGTGHCLSDQIRSFCSRQSLQPVSIERTSQIATIQELVSLNHGVSIVPKMASDLDTSKNRIYRSFSAPTPTRTIALVSNPYRYQSRWVKAFRKHVRSEYC